MENSKAMQLKALLARLGEGEDLASVREDFVKEFKSVPVKDIMDAEQALLKDGADPKQVTKLCDLHSGLFHGKTEGEVIREQKRLKKQELLQLPEGHPVDYFIRENSALEQLLNNLEMALEAGGHDDKVKMYLLRLKKVRGIYSKKEELIMAPLERYGITGPSQVMWNVDDQIKAETGRLYRGIQRSSAAEMKEYILPLIKRIREMIYKDENILLPVAMQNLTDGEWVDVYRDLFEMGPVYIREIPKWEHGERVLKERAEAEAAAREAERAGAGQNAAVTAEAAGAGAGQRTAADGAAGAGAGQNAAVTTGAAGAGAGQSTAADGAIGAAAGEADVAAGIPEKILEHGVVHFHGDGGKTPAGELTVAQLKGILSILPVDVTFIDDGPINRFYKNTDKVFSRPVSTLGHSTYHCHPVPIRAVVKSLTDDFRSGARDEFSRWIPNPDRPVKVTYLAVRDEDGKYLGAAEIIEDMTDAFQHFKMIQAAQERDAAWKKANQEAGQGQNPNPNQEKKTELDQNPDQDQEKKTELDQNPDQDQEKKTELDQNPDTGAKPKAEEMPEDRKPLKVNLFNVLAAVQKLYPGMNPLKIKTLVPDFSPNKMKNLLEQADAGSLPEDTPAELKDMLVKVLAELRKD